jgi:hypothetical protein
VIRSHIIFRRLVAGFGRCRGAGYLDGRQNSRTVSVYRHGLEGMRASGGRARGKELLEGRSRWALQRTDIWLRRRDLGNTAATDSSPPNLDGKWKYQPSIRASTWLTRVILHSVLSFSVRLALARLVSKWHSQSRSIPTRKQYLIRRYRVWK